MKRGLTWCDFPGFDGCALAMKGDVLLFRNSHRSVQGPRGTLAPALSPVWDELPAFVFRQEGEGVSRIGERSHSQQGRTRRR